MSKVDKLHVSVHKQNVGQIANLTLNHGGMPELPLLIAHNFRFFGGFSHLHVLDKLLSFRRSCDVRLGSKIKKMYISDINRYLKNPHCYRYIRASDDFKPSRAYSEETFPEEYCYYISKTEGYEKCEPGVFDVGYNDMKVAELYLLPQPLRRDVCREKNDIEEFEISDILDFQDDEDIGPPPQHGVKVYKKDYTDLEKSLKWLEDNQVRISKEYDELCIAEFMMKDVNRANRLAIHTTALVSQLEAHARVIPIIYGDQLREKHGDPFGEKEFLRNLERLIKQIKEMSGINLEDLDNQVRETIEPDRLRLKEITKELVSAKNDENKTISLNGEAARIRMKIKDMFNEHAYLSDEILCRDTIGQCAINVSDYLSALSSYKSMTEIAPGDNPHSLTFWESNCLPGIGDLNIAENMKKLKWKSQKTGQKFIDNYANAKYLALRTMGKKWVEIMEKYYPCKLREGVDLEVETDLSFERLKKKFLENLSSGNSEVESEIDPLVGLKDNLVGLIYILNRDHSFIKKLPEAFDLNFTKLLAEFKRNMYYLNNESADEFYLTVRNYRQFPMLDYVGQKKEAEFAKDLKERKPKYQKVEPCVRSNRQMAEEEGVNFRIKGRGGMFFKGVLDSLKHLSYILGDEVALSPVEMRIPPSSSHVFSETEPLPPKENYLPQYTYVFKRNYREVLERNPEIRSEKKELDIKANLVEELLRKVTFCKKEDALDDDYDIKLEEVYEASRKRKNELHGVKIKYSKHKIQTPSTSLLGENRFSILYDDPQEVAESEEVARMILSNSENMNIIFDWQKYKLAKKEAKIIREHMSPNLTKDEYCRALQKVAYRNRTNTYTRYRCNGLKDCILELLLCYKKRMVPDLKFLKSVYGFKRHQLRHMIKNLTAVCRILNDQIKIARFNNIPLKL